MRDVQANRKDIRCAERAAGETHGDMGDQRENIHSARSGTFRAYDLEAFPEQLLKTRLCQPSDRDHQGFKPMFATQP